MSLPVVFIRWSVICDCCISSSYQLVFNLFHYDGFSYTYRYNPFCALRGHRSKFLNFNVFLFLKIVFIFIAKSADSVSKLFTNVPVYRYPI